ncbi:cyclic AMP-dependent protein kinase catalytic subunit [Flagelloscypha sp. PMI_526]|nr:cyclic AMP-dependent protein kinase catalytic subunit [Flagelloscypha sp. PMI_526]
MPGTTFTMRRSAPDKHILLNSATISSPAYPSPMGDAPKPGPFHLPCVSPYFPLRIVEDEEDIDMDDSVFLDDPCPPLDSEALLPPYSPAFFADSPHTESEDGSSNPRNLDDEPDHLQNDLFTLQNLEPRGTLGCGTFGRVLLVRHQRSDSNSRFYALKVLPKDLLERRRQIEHVEAERFILSRVQHPFIVELFATFQDERSLYMLLEYCPGGELFTHLRRAGRFSIDVTRFYMANIVLALRYLHSYNIIYRDLKPENLLLDSRGYLCLTDFGFAKVVPDRTWTLCGTPEYLAPEIIQNDGHGKAADWWACGVLTYEMLVGHSPFVDESVFAIYEKILEARISHWPPDLGPVSKGLIRAFLMPDLSNRLGNLSGGSQDILDHPWFHGVDWNLVERREIAAPIIPHLTSQDDTRHFPKLPCPEVSGLLGSYSPNAPSHPGFANF